MVQQKQTISMNPQHWYRGVGSNCINMGSCTMIQFVIGGKLRQYVQNGNNDYQLSLQQEMLCGIGAGSISALVGSPLELIMIQQQRKGTNTLKTIQNIASNSLMNISRGFIGCMTREALWTCGYLSIPPVVRRTLMTNYPNEFPDNNRARVPAALLGGLFACYLTHPFDTIKTCMQGDIERTTYSTFTSTASLLYKENGIRAFYRGATFRYGRMVCAVFIMDYLRDQVAIVLYPKAFE